MYIVEPHCCCVSTTILARNRFVRFARMCVLDIAALQLETTQITHTNTQCLGHMHGLASWLDAHAKRFSSSLCVYLRHSKVFSIAVVVAA